MIDANYYEIKKVLSFVRGDDFAHPGEKEAIDKVFELLPKNKDQLILDVGCGLGGTANYVVNQDWGSVIGFDIEENAVIHAKKNYPNIEFHLSDVINVSKAINAKFDLIYMFNVFYAFTDQLQALTELKKLSKEKTQLAIFDYVKLGEYKKINVIRKPINLNTIESELNSTGWQLKKIINLDEEYQKWYYLFVMKIRSKKKQIIEFAGIDVYEFVLATYTQLLANIENKMLGGAIIYASV